LKICKIAGVGIIVGTPFNFTISPSTATIPVQAGPPAEGGYCTVVAGTFQVGTSVTVTEMVPAVDAAPAITVNGVSTASADCTPSPNALLAAPFMCSVVAMIGPGINEVSFTNSCAGLSCPITFTVSTIPDLAMVNYSLVGQVASTTTKSYMTYRADLLNTGTTTLGPMIAKLSSPDPSGIEIVGEGALNFASVPGNSPVASSNTFTILVDPRVPLDFSKLKWKFYSRRNIPPPR
jgi:hypothetical protein